MQHNGAKLLVECLIQHGVKRVFGIPGAKVDSIFEALREREDAIKLTVCRHEQNAAFMAAMHGRLTGQPGIVIVTSGPGVTNLATGLLTATSEGDPVIAIGANVPRKMRLKQTHQGLDNALSMKAVTKQSIELETSDSIPEAIETAFRVSTQGRGGAFFISVPQDILMETTNLQANKPVPAIQQGAASSALIKQAAELINNAKMPMLLLGMHASKCENSAAIRLLLEQHALPVVSTFQAAGVVPREFMNCFIGRVGLFQNQPGDQALNQADVIFTIGYDPIEYDPEIWNSQSSNKKIIHLDTTPAEIHTTYLPTLELIGDISLTLQSLTQQLSASHALNNAKMYQQLHDTLIEKINSGKNLKGNKIHPLRFIHDLQQFIDDKTFIVSDIGSHYMWLARYLFLHEPRHLLFSNGQQTLGVALPWAIATRMLHPQNKIISVSGDGGFLFSAMELETAVREKCHFVHCVWRDGSYNMVAEQEKMKYQHESGVQFGKIDLVKYAESFGAKGYAVTDSEMLIPTLKEALQQSVPVLVDIPIDYSDNPELFAAVDPQKGN